MRIILFCVVFIFCCSYLYADFYEFAQTGEFLTFADCTFTGEFLGDYSGYSVSSAGDIDADGKSDILISAVNNDEGGSGAGKVYLFLGKNIINGTLSLSSADYMFLGENAGDGLGVSITGNGDFDNDGRSDIIICARGHNSSAGKTYVISGQSLAAICTPPCTIDLASLPSDLVVHTFIGENRSDYSGCSIAWAGDVNGGGCDDILIGAYGYDLGCGTLPGMTYLILGEDLSSAISSDNNLADSDYKFMGSATEASGDCVSRAGDVDGDGLSDILIGAYLNSDSASFAGKTYLIFGKNITTGTTLLNVSADFTFLGENSNDYSGTALSAGNFDDDGYSDIIVCADFNDDSATNAGKIYIITGDTINSRIAARLTSMNLSIANMNITGEADGDNFGDEISQSGDIDGDGLDDVIIGAFGSNDEATAGGKAYIVLGSTLQRNISSGVSLLSAGGIDYIFFGTDYSWAGCSVSFGGDIDANGTDDILIGAALNSDTASTAGKTYLVLTEQAYYVDNTCGTDAAGTKGTPTEPFETIQYGISRAYADGVADVIVQGGVYEELIALEPNIALKGRKRLIGSTEWAPVVYYTPYPDYLVEGADDALIQGFILCNQGIRLSGCSNMTIKHNFIYGDEEPQELIYLTGNIISGYSTNNIIQNNIICAKHWESPVISIGMFCNNNSFINNTIHSRDLDPSSGTADVVGVYLANFSSGNVFRNNIIDTITHYTSGGTRYGFYAGGSVARATIQYNKTPLNNYGITLDSTNIVRSSLPRFVNPIPYGFDYTLRSSSLCIDAGDPDSNYNDIDGTRNDIGAFGGPEPIIE